MITIDQVKMLKNIDRVVIHSLDRSVYQVSVEVGGLEHYVITNKGLPVKAYNKLDLQGLFKRVNVREMVLRHESAYDEMVGQPVREESNTLEVRLGGTELSNKRDSGLQ